MRSMTMEGHRTERSWRLGIVEISKLLSNHVAQGR